MNLKSIIKMAFQSFFSNKLRTFLTMLGIIIGVFAVVVLISIGQGATKGVTESISSMGANIISVNVFDKKQELKLKDLDGLDQLQGVKRLTPVFTTSANVKKDLENKRVSINGGNEDFLVINNYQIRFGRGLTPIDVDFRNSVAVLGKKTAENLFGLRNPLDQKISINGKKYTVVGILEEKESNLFGDSNEIIVVPITTLMRQYRVNQVNSITVQAESAKESPIAKENINDYLKNYFKSEDSFAVLSQDEMLSILEDVTGTLTIMLGGIAGISLLVGGIGIMNIMLVTVTERTREIGIRKAIGAGRGNILVQFLIESAVISGIGGMMGIGLGVATSYMITKAMGIKYITNFSVILIALLFSLFVGVFFGLYPANKASKFKPVDALRYE